MFVPSKACMCSSRQLCVSSLSALGKAPFRARWGTIGKRCQNSRHQQRRPYTSANHWSFISGRYAPASALGSIANALRYIRKLVLDPSYTLYLDEAMNEYNDTISPADVLTPAETATQINDTTHLPLLNRIYSLLLVRGNLSATLELTEMRSRT